jgi:hypothetical protein
MTAADAAQPATGLAPHETRAATLSACLQRLQREHAFEVGAARESALTVLLVGADHREGNSSDETFAFFQAFCARVARGGRFSRLRLALIGPNVARALHGTSASRVLQLGDDGEAEEGGCAARCELECQLRYFVGSFDAYHGDAEAYWSPDLAVCFNAGIWGYDEWRPTLRLLLLELRAPVLVTSYNENEAGDDEDVLEELAPAARWFWRAEKNPCGSAARRATRNAIGSVLRENDFWMCLGGPEQLPAVV